MKCKVPQSVRLVGGGDASGVLLVAGTEQTWTCPRRAKHLTTETFTTKHETGLIYYCCNVMPSNISIDLNLTVKTAHGR